MADRQQKLEYRKRGADASLRQVSVTPLEIKEMAKPKMLESALVKQEDMNLPRFRRRTMSEGRDRKEEGGGGDGTDEVEVVEDVNVVEDVVEGVVEDVGDVNVVDVVEDVVEAAQEPPVPQEPPQPKRRPGRPRKEKPAVEVAPGPKRKRGRPRKGEEVVHEKVEIDLSEGSIASRRRQREAAAAAEAARRPKRHRSVETAPQPLVSRSLVVDVERLVTDSNRDKRYKLNTIDVLQELVRRFEPETVETDSINSTRVQADFRTHVLDYLTHLSDAHGTIYDLNFEISKVRKAKDEMREKIFNLRRQYKQVSDELNGLRSDYHQSQKQHDEVIDLTDCLAEIKTRIRDGKPDLVSSINQNVSVLDKLFNGKTGLRRNIVEVNEKLKRLDDDI